MKHKARQHTQRYKKDAVQLALNSVSVLEAAKSLDMPEATLHIWVPKAKQSGTGMAPKAEAPVDVDELIRENQTLKQRLHRVKQEKQYTAPS